MLNSEISIYFMYDNHTFSKLSNNFNIAVDQVNNILKEGNTYGSIVSHYTKKIVHLHEDKELADKKYLDMLNMYKDLGLVQ